MAANGHGGSALRREQTIDASGCERSELSNGRIVETANGAQDVKNDEEFGRA